MTYWFPDTCNCICNIESQELIAKCDSHIIYNDVLIDNQNHNLKFGREPTETEIEIISNDKNISLRNSSKAVLIKTLSIAEFIELLPKLKQRLKESEKTRLNI